MAATCYRRTVKLGQ